MGLFVRPNLELFSQVLASGFQKALEVEVVATKLDLKEWVVEAMKAHGGVAHPIDIAKFIWMNYQDEHQSAGDLFYTWQHEVQWAIVGLRKEGKGSLFTMTDYDIREY